MCEALCRDDKAVVPMCFWGVVGAWFAGAVALVVWYAPEEETMGVVQKIFYLHLPVAICTFLACAVSFVASIGYLAKRGAWWDDLAAAAARVAVQLCSVVLVTGMIWGKSAWGQWWTWSPRLTFSLVLWLLYVVYLAIRMSVPSGRRRAVVSAIYGVVAFLDVPLVWLSARMMPDIHPPNIELAPAMRWTLIAWFPPVVLLTVGMIHTKYGTNRAERVVNARNEEEAAAAAAAGSPTGFNWAGGAA
jgi:heme exporter protein C